MAEKQSHLTFMMEVLQNIFKDCDLNVQRYERLRGGDINSSYCLFTTTGKYFLKVNDKNKYPLMFTREASGLHKLREFCTLKIPQVIKHGSCNDQQYLILEWLENGTPKKDTEVWPQQSGHVEVAALVRGGLGVS